MRRSLIFPLILLLILLTGCAGPGSPAETPAPAPEESSGAESVLERFDLDPEEIDRITYSALHFGKRTLNRGDEGFDQTLALLKSLRGTPAPLPRRAVSRELRINDGGIPLVLEYDGEKLYANLGYSEDNLLLAAAGRPDDGLEEIFARCAPGPEPIPFEGGYLEDGPVALRTEKPVYDYAVLQEAICLTLNRFKEPGSAEGHKSEAVVLLTAENCGEEPVGYSMAPGLLAYRAGNWYWVPARIGLADDLLPRQMGPGESLELILTMERFDDPLGPGLYRACMFYSVGTEQRAVRSHVAYAEFEIGSKAGP